MIFQQVRSGTPTKTPAQRHWTRKEMARTGGRLKFYKLGGVEYYDFRE